MSSWMKDWDNDKGYGTKDVSKAETEYYTDYTGTKKGWTSSWKHCWEDNHKPIKILNGEVFGGACSAPQDGYDIYIGLDYGMKFKSHVYPWHTGDEVAPIEFLFKISDMHAPAAKNVEDFKAMIAWMAEQLQDGKRIQVGCIGGHGRTGLVLAALVAHVGIAPKNAIQWVRKKHCSKAVESEAQVKFLMKHYGVSKAEPTKSAATPAYSGSKKGRINSKGKKGAYDKLPNVTVDAIKTKGSIW